MTIVNSNGLSDYMKSLFYLLRFTFYLGVSLNAFADTIFLYRNMVNVEVLTLESSRHIFDGSKLSWENGKNIVLLVEKMDDVGESKFLSFSRLSKSQYISRWRTKFYSGRALMPVPVKNISSELETLKTNPSSIYFSFKELPSKYLPVGDEKFKVDQFSF